MNADHAHDQSRGKTPRASESIVEVRSRVVHVGRTSLSVLADVYAEAIASGVRRHTNECWLTFVHLDDEGRPAPVPPLKLETQEDRLISDLAQRRREALLTEKR